MVQLHQLFDWGGTLRICLDFLFGGIENYNEDKCLTEC